MPPQKLSHMLPSDFRLVHEQNYLVGHLWQRPNDIRCMALVEPPKRRIHDNRALERRIALQRTISANATTCSAPADRASSDLPSRCLIVKPYPSLIVSSAKSCFSVVIERNKCVAVDSTFARRSAL